MGSDEAPSILDWRGKIVSGRIPSSVRVDMGQTDIWAPVSMTEGDLMDLVEFFVLLVKVGIVRPISLYEGRCSLMVSDRSGFLKGLDLTHPWCMSCSMCGNGMVLTVLQPQFFMLCARAARWPGVVGTI